MKKYLSLLLAAVLLCTLCACGQTPSEPVSNQGQTQAAQGETDSQSDTNETPADFTKTDGEMFTDRDLSGSWQESKAIKIQLNGTSAQASADSVKISGSTVEITQEATYLISGTLTDGQLIVCAPDSAKVQLVLSGAHITSSTTAPLYIQEADKVFVTLAEGTENTLENGGTFSDSSEAGIDGAVFSKQDLTINGTGSLTVTSPGGHGIVCKDDLVITGGTIRVDAASHALDANDSVRITGAAITATAGKDGIHCENSDDAAKGFVYQSGGSVKLEAQGDGISAGYYLHITDGTVEILAGGGSENAAKESSDHWGGFMGGGHGGGRPGSSGGMHSTSFATTDDDSSTSMKGLKSAGEMRIDGGSITVDSADDALHSNTSMTVTGGTFTIASGDDALHGEDTLTVSGGTVRISTCYEGLEALHVLVTGGDISLVASDDGLNAAGGTDSSGMGGRDNMFGGGMGGMGGMGGSSNGSIVISGGALYINASGDGIDANGTLEISGGHTTVVGPTQGDTATLDYDTSAVISGGTFLGTGASNMAQTFSDSQQGVIALTVGNQSAGTGITVADSSGKVLVDYSPALSYQVVIISTPDLVSGESYTVGIGALSDEFTAA